MNGFDFSEFTQMINQLEGLGADMNKVAEHVLDAGSEPARAAFAENVPYDSKTPESMHSYKHAKDNVVVSKTRTARKSKNKYRLIDAKTNKTDPKTGEAIPYLYYREYGTTKNPAKPWVDKAYTAAQAAASTPMENALIQEIDNHLR